MHDSFLVQDLALCQVRLINNACFPWLILVPRLEQIVEITDLSHDQYLQVNQELLIIAKLMQKIFKPDKLNIATLGNQVKQLHYHIIVRYKHDGCFPKPVWGENWVGYAVDDRKSMIEKINNYMDLL